MASDAPTAGGAVAISEYGILPVFGAAIQLNPGAHSIMEAAMVTNANFHTGAGPAVLDMNDLPGPKSL